MNEQNGERLRVSTKDKKYTVVQESDGNLYAHRYGEKWRTLTGDNLILALAYELDEARKLNLEAEDIIKGFLEMKLKLDSLSTSIDLSIYNAEDVELDIKSLKMISANLKAAIN